MSTHPVVRGTRIAPPHRAGHTSAAGLVAATLITPALLFYLGLASSFASGLVLVALYILVTTAGTVTSTQPAMPIIAGARSQRTIALITLAVVVHLLMAITLHRVDFPRAAASAVLLIITLAAAARLANALMSSSSDRLHDGLLKVFGILCIVALGGALGVALNWGPPTLAAEPWRRPVFPFSEPATFALAFIPVLMYVCTSTHGTTRLTLVLVGLACSAMIQNLTLACGVALVALVTLRAHVLALVLVPLVVVLQQVDLTYVTDRIDVSGESNNFSNLVYLQGWQMIDEAMERTGYMGLGFQQLGVEGTDVAAAQIIRALKKDGEDMNLLDGGFVFAKLGADFGVFGVLAAFAYLAIAMRSLVTLRSVAFRQSRLPSALILSHAAVLTFGIEMFVRGAGYFSGTALLFLASLWVVLRSRQRRPGRPAAMQRNRHA